MMQTPKVAGVVSLSLLLGSSLTYAGSPTVRKDAGSFLPDQWINQKEAVSPDYFEGRLILLERWATWCSPCVANIPHLNKLTQEFGKQGLTVIGITDETAAVAGPFAVKKGIKYMIGRGGAEAYDSKTIPHAWLISPNGRVLWSGYPRDLNEETIREHLKNVTAAPEFQLPAKLKAAEKLLNGKKFGEGLKALKSAAAKDASLTQTAEETIAEVENYGKKRLKSADELIAGKKYSDANVLLAEVIQAFQGTEIGDTAKTRQETSRTLAMNTSS